MHVVGRYKRVYGVIARHPKPEHSSDCCCSFPSLPPSMSVAGYFLDNIETEPPGGKGGMRAEHPGTEL